MNLPKKDKNGRSKLSYSQIAQFLRDPKEYMEIYIKNRPFEGNAYTEFGNKVGKALEFNNFQGFSIDEVDTLKKVTRLDEFEKMVKIEFNDFYMIGFIDTLSSDYNTIIDYKTGGKNKESEYEKDTYTQLQYYALGLRQQYKITPQEAYVNFIRREGNAFRGEILKVANEEPIMIPVDVSYERLKRVYWNTFKVAKEIEKLYEWYLNQVSIGNQP